MMDGVQDTGDDGNGEDEPDEAYAFEEPVEGLHRGVSRRMPSVVSSADA